MARIDRIFARRNGSYTKRVLTTDAATKKPTRKRISHLVHRDEWWKKHAPDLAEAQLKAAAARAEKLKTSPWYPRRRIA